jgi:hypothetical protein
MCYMPDGMFPSKVPPSILSSFRLVQHFIAYKVLHTFPDCFLFCLPWKPRGRVSIIIPTVVIKEPGTEG